MRFAFCLLATAGLFGCSWQNTLHTAAKTPDALRLDEHVWVSNPPRFRLSSDAHVVLVDDGATPSAWVDAADAGLARVFAKGAGAHYRLLVDWPAPVQEPVRIKQSGFKAGLLGLTDMPSVPPRQALSVMLQDPDGQMIASMDLNISPTLWGAAWSDPELLGTSFVRLAEVLTGR